VRQIGLNLMKPRLATESAHRRFDHDRIRGDGMHPEQSEQKPWWVHSSECLTHERAQPKLAVTATRTASLQAPWLYRRWKTHPEFVIAKKHAGSAAQLHDELKPRRGHAAHNSCTSQAPAGHSPSYK